MKRSENRILVTHVGALPRPQELGALVMSKTRGQTHDTAKLSEWLRSAVGDVVAQQVDADLSNPGEHCIPCDHLAKQRFGSFYVDREVVVDEERSDLSAISFCPLFQQ